MSITENSLIIGSFPEVYVVRGGQRHWITSEVYLEPYGGWPAVQLVSEEELLAIPLGEHEGLLPEGAIFRGISQPEVYIIISAQRRWVQNEEQLNQLGGWSRVLVVRDETIAQIPESQPYNTAGSNIEAIRAYLAGLPPIRREPASSRSIRENITIQNVDGIQYRFQEQVVRLIKTTSEFATINPVWDVIYPGALVQGSSLPGNQLAPILLNRAPGMIVIASDFVLPSQPRLLSRFIIAPTLENIQNTRTELLSQLNPTSSAGQIYQFFCTARTLEDGMVKLGINIRGATYSGSLSARLDTSLETNTAICRFNQAYYTVVFQPSGSPAYFFSDEVSLDDLLTYSSAENPPCYISSVSYGRTLILLATGRTSRLTLEAALKAAVNGATNVNVEIEGSYRQVINESTIQILSIGGAPQAYLQAISGGVEGIRANFS